MADRAVNYWIYRLHRTASNGQPVFAAQYMAATDVKSTDIDLASNQSHLRDFLRTYTRKEPEVFVRHHQIAAQALLGGLVACSDCMIRFGIWLPVDPPTPRSIRKPLKAIGEAVGGENGVELWLQEKGNLEFEV
jgi:hypothetical protein